MSSSKVINSVNDGQRGTPSESNHRIAQIKPVRPAVWYCPSRWLIAHHDPQADIHTWSSHMCLADLNNDGESLLALVDFKQRPQNLISSADLQSKLANPRSLSPYDCRLQVYRGQQLIYSHFLDDLPACLLISSIRSSPASFVGNNLHQKLTSTGTITADLSRSLLTLAINNDVYFYHKLRPSHRLILEDEECILDSLDKSEVDTWQMVRQKKVDIETLHQLLSGLSDELGVHELTSHSNNFLSLESSEERKKYLVAWKLKRYPTGGTDSLGASAHDGGEQLMSMDTICCAAARLSYNSSVTLSGNFGQTRETKTFLNNVGWNRILDIQRDGLVLGTEDKHLLIYETRAPRCRFESHCRLPSQADFILVERRSPSSFDFKQDLKMLTYKILVSCRNCRIYSLEHKYIVDSKKLTCDSSSELVALRCNVVEMSWTEDEAVIAGGKSYPNFIVASLDRKVHCFGSQFGDCKWVVETESPVTCIVGLPQLNLGANESSLVGIASQANRVDFHVSSTGRIVDSIYFANDNCRSMVFGRFGREDNCLCITTEHGQLMIFILKRTAKFAHGQCLSSAASYAADTLASCHLLANMSSQKQSTDPSDTSGSGQQLKLDKPAALPSGFALAAKSTASSMDKAIDSLQLDHDCDQVNAKSFLDAHLANDKLQIPSKSRAFVDQIVEQSQHSALISRTFAKHMLKLRDKIKSTIEQQLNMRSLDSRTIDGNRVTLVKTIGLGNTYRITLSLRLNMERHLRPKVSGEHDTMEAEMDPLSQTKSRMATSVLLFVDTSSRQMSSAIQSTQYRACQVRPFRFELDFHDSSNSCASKQPPEQHLMIPDTWGRVGKQQNYIFEKTIEFQLTTWSSGDEGEQAAGSDLATLDVYTVMDRAGDIRCNSGRVFDHHNGLVFIGSVNVPTC